MARSGPSTSSTLASQIANTPAGTIAATNVQAAVNELDGDIQAVIAAKATKLRSLKLDTASATLTLADYPSPTFVWASHTSVAIVYTVPTNASHAHPVGTQIDISRGGAADVSVAAAGGVTIVSADSKLKLNKTGSAASLFKIATDTWLLVGDLKA